MSQTRDARDMLASLGVLSGEVGKTIEQQIEAEAGYKALTDSVQSDIETVLDIRYPRATIKFFGSRVSGLATPQSDIDVYVGIGPGLSIMDVEDLFRAARRHFEVNEVILTANTPIMTMRHRRTGLNCDLNCTNEMGYYDNKLVKVLLDLNPKVRFLVTAVRLWFKYNQLLDKKKFNNFGVTLMALFVLMKHQVIPTADQLQRLYSGPLVMCQRFDCGFCTDVNTIKSKCSLDPDCNLDAASQKDLLLKFFSYYAHIQPYEKMLFLSTGEEHPISEMDDPHLLGHRYNFLTERADEFEIKRDQPIYLFGPFNKRKNHIHVDPDDFKTFLTFAREAYSMIQNF